jgi:hypothetical protein
MKELKNKHIVRLYDSIGDARQTVRIRWYLLWSDNDHRAMRRRLEEANWV